MQPLRPPRPATARPTCRARTHCRPTAARARRSPSSTPTTTRPPRPTWPSTASSTACPRAPPPTAASARSTSAAAPTTRRRRRLGRRDLARPRHGLRRRARRAHPAGRGGRPATSTTSAPRVDEAVALGAKYVSNSYGTGYDSDAGQRRGPVETTTIDPYYNHPGVAVVAATGDDGYGVTYPAASQYVTVGRRHLADPRLRHRPRLVASRCGTTPTAARAPAARSTSRSPPSRRTPAARSAPSPTSPRSPTRPPASRSTRPTAGSRLGGLRRHQRRPRRSSRACTPSRAPRPPGTYPNSYPYAQPGRAQRRHHRQPTAPAPPAYLCTAGTGYDGPTGLGTPNGLAAFTHRPARRLSPAPSPTPPPARRSPVPPSRAGDHTRARPTPRATTRWPSRRAPTT